MNKFSFIKNILDNEKFNATQKDRFLKLVSDELINSHEVDGQVLKDITLIKEKIGLEDTGNGEVEIKNKFQYPKIHDVRLLVSLMNQFSDNSKALKYTTHSWEYGRFLSYEDFRVKINKEWSLISKELGTLNPRLSAKISNFLFNNKLGQKKNDKYYHAWGDKKLKFGWSSKSLVAYMDDDNLDPFNCPIPEDIKRIEGRYNFLSFEDYVNEFKNEIEIREDNSGLLNLINNLWTDELNYDFNVEGQENTQGVSFFTDVQYLKAVLKIIFKSFKKRPEFPNIICNVDKNFEKNYVELSICQKDSICNRSIKDPKIISPSGGDFSTIIEGLENLADFSVIGKFADSNVYRINYLTSNDNVVNIQKKEENDSCKGFTYLLKFYL